MGGGQRQPGEAAAQERGAKNTAKNKPFSVFGGRSKLPEAGAAPEGRQKPFSVFGGRQGPARSRGRPGRLPSLSRFWWMGGAHPEPRLTRKGAIGPTRFMVDGRSPSETKASSHVGHQYGVRSPAALHPPAIGKRRDRPWNPEANRVHWAVSTPVEFVARPRPTAAWMGRTWLGRTGEGRPGLRRPLAVWYGNSVGVIPPILIERPPVWSSLRFSGCKPETIQDIIIQNF